MTGNNLGTTVESIMVANKLERERTAQKSMCHNSSAGTAQAEMPAENSYLLAGRITQFQ